MEPRVTPIAATLGAVVTDLELARMDVPTWKTVEEAFHEHAVLVFPGQHLTEEQQVAFANRFGEIELLAPDPEQKAVAISNQKPDGTVLGSRRASLQVAARQRGMAHRQLVHAAGGQGLRALGAGGARGRRRDRVGRHAGRLRRAGREHAPAHRGALGAPLALSLPGQDRSRGPDGGRVRLPHEGRAAASAGEEASRHRAAPPCSSAATPTPSPASTRRSRRSSCPTSSTSPVGRPRTYAHRWQPGDVVIWDNRCVLHRARPYDYRRAAGHASHPRRRGSGHRAGADRSRRAGRRLRAVHLEPVAYATAGEQTSPEIPNEEESSA